MEGIAFDYTAGKFWIDLIQLAAIAVLGFYNWLSNRHRVTREAIELMSKDFTALKSEFDILKENHSHQPKWEDMEKFEGRMDDLDRALSENTAQLKATNTLLLTVHTHLLSGGNKT